MLKQKLQINMGVQRKEPMPAMEMRSVLGQYQDIPGHFR